MQKLSDELMAPTFDNRIIDGPINDKGLLEEQLQEMQLKDEQSQKD